MTGPLRVVKLTKGDIRDSRTWVCGVSTGERYGFAFFFSFLFFLTPCFCFFLDTLGSLRVVHAHLFLRRSVKGRTNKRKVGDIGAKAKLCVGK